MKSIKKTGNTVKLRNTKKNLKDTKKICLIFDLDEALLKTLSYKEEINYMNIDKNTEYKSYHINSKTKYRNIFIRNYTLFIIDYCLKHFNVGIWTNAPIAVKEIELKKIFPKEMYDKFNVIIGRTTHDLSKMFFKDIKNNKKFKLYKYNGFCGKNLDFLFEDKFYSKIFNKKNTLLIDDSQPNIAISPLNTIFLPKYCYSKNDNYLFHLYLWFKKNKNTKNIQKIEKIKFQDYKKNFKTDCQNKEIYKLVKTKKIKLGDYVQLKKKDNELNGYITLKNNNTYNIVEYDKTKEEEQELKEHKNVKIENIRKYVFN